MTVPRPAGYYLLPGWPEVADRLAAHGIRVVPLKEERAAVVGTYRVKEPVFSSFPYQGRMRVTAKFARGEEKRTLPAGTLYVPLDDELAPVAIALLEPEGPDSLFSWGLLSAALEQKEWIDLRVLDPLAEKLLADPEVAAAWKEKLRAPAFEKSSRERIRFFLDKTPYRDEMLGLLPIYRSEAPPAGLTPAGAASAAAPE